MTKKQSKELEKKLSKLYDMMLPKKKMTKKEKINANVRLKILKTILK